MGPLRKSVAVRLEEGAHARLRRHSLRSGVPTSALVRAFVHRWLEEQGEVGEATTGPPGPEREANRGSSARKKGREGPRRAPLGPWLPSCIFIGVRPTYGFWRFLVTINLSGPRHSYRRQLETR